MRRDFFGVGVMGLAMLAGYACGDDVTETSGTSSGGSSTSSSNGGSGGSGGNVACIPGLQAITLSPADSTVLLTGAPPADIPYVATGLLSNGTSVTIDGNNLNWSVSRQDATPPGTVAAGIVSPFPQAGGLVTVAATDGCVAGDTTLNLQLNVSLGTPSDPVAWGTPPVDGAGSPEIVYPSDTTVFPRNIYRTIFQWYSQGMTEFRITYTGPHSTVEVYTDGAHGLCAGANPAAGCWEVDEVAWNYIAASNAGEEATWVVDGLDTSTTPPTVRRSAPNIIGFSKQDVEGAVFYWSTTSAGVRRGRISQPDPEDYIVGKPNGTQYGDDEVECVACHTVSRDGKYMVAPVKSNNTNSLWVMEVTAQPPPTPLVTDVANTSGHGFATISPDNNHVVVSFKKQDEMWMVDRATGAHEAQLPTMAFGGGTQPDWSPDNTQLVFATGEGDGPGDASLALIPWDGSTWGQPSILVDPPSGLSNLFPMFSPTGDWIAYAVGEGGHGDNTAQLHLINKAGGAPIELLNCNRIANNMMTDGMYQNSQPTWAPPGDYNWIAFNTKRDFGVIRDDGNQQIWVSAVDLDKATNGDDPSYPAFRVPFQGLDENNHRAFWTLDIGSGGAGGAGGGGGQGGAGGAPPCADILSEGQACNAVEDCCETGLFCDTLDDGDTYICIKPDLN